MAQLTIDIPDNKVQELLNAFAWYVALVPPETKAQHAREQIRLFVKSVYKAWRVYNQKQALQNATQAQIDALDASAETEGETITVT